MKNGNGKDYANKHPDESKASEVANVLGKPLNIFKKFQENFKEDLKKKYKSIVEPKFIDKL